jgi:hypothetical protein
MKRDPRTIRSALRKTMPPLLVASLLGTQGCMSWQPLGSDHVATYDEQHLRDAGRARHRRGHQTEEVPFDDAHLRGREVRITYEDRVVTMLVHHAASPLVTGAVLEDVHGSSATSLQGQVCTLDLRAAQKIDVHVRDEARTAAAIAIPTTVGAVLLGVAVWGLVSSASFHLGDTGP